MKIIQLKAENIKKLKAIQIDPKGNVVHITGPNGSGKSSILDSIYYALAGTKNIPATPVHVGEERAYVRLDLGEIVVTRRFTSDGKTTLVVEAANGSRFSSPQAMLDGLTQNLTFDPLAFTRFSPKEQLETLKKLVKLDDIDALDGQNQTDYENRAEINRKVKQLEGQLAALPQIDPKFLADGPPALIDEAGLLKEFQSAANDNVFIDRERNIRGNLKHDSENLRKRATDLRAQADQLEAEALSTETRLASFPPLHDLKDLNGMKLELDNAKILNAVVRKHYEREELVKQLAIATGASDQLTQRMTARLKQKEEAIARAPMPIKGLSFGEGEVMFNGVPFSQASSAEQLCVSTVIACALNPKLRVLRIADGSLLDEKNLELISKIADRADMQCWIEQVSSADPLAIHMEDGEIVDVTTKPKV